MFTPICRKITLGLRARRRRLQNTDGIRVGVFTSVRDELDLDEWIRYHLAIGADAILLYDNESVPRVEVSDPRVTVIRWPGLVQQLAMYNDCWQRFGHQFDWLVFIDVDEYLMPVRHANLKTMLAEYNEYDALVVNWLMFGPSGHEDRPEGGVLANYCYRLPESHPRNLHIKTIYRPDAIQGWFQSHYPRYRPWHFAVDENRQIVEGPVSRVWTGDVVRLYHYWTRSRADWERYKIFWPRPDNGEHRSWEEFEEVARAATVFDDSMARYAEKLGLNAARSTGQR